MTTGTWLAQNWFKILFLLLLGYAIFVYQHKESEVPIESSPDIKVVQVESSTSTEKLTSEVDLSSIIKDWYPSVVKVGCFIKDSEAKISEQNGSGFLVREDGLLYVMTNKHVISGIDGTLPELCTIKLSNKEIDPQILKITNNASTSNEMYLAASDLDYGHLVIKYPEREFQKTNPYKTPFCTSRTPLGTPLITIGYPEIGSLNDITVTQGIIAGYEGDYYITDAKIGHGNSGGVAIDLKENCLIGITSYARVGETETLGRILNIQSILTDNNNSF